MRTGAVGVAMEGIGAVLTTKAGSGSILKVAAVRIGSKKYGVVVVTQCDTCLTWASYLSM